MCQNCHTLCKFIKRLLDSLNEVERDGSGEAELTYRGNVFVVQHTHRLDLVTRIMFELIISRKTSNLYLNEGLPNSMMKLAPSKKSYKIRRATFMQTQKRADALITEGLER